MRLSTLSLLLLTIGCCEVTRNDELDTDLQDSDSDEEVLGGKDEGKDSTADGDVDSDTDADTDTDTDADRDAGTDANTGPYRDECSRTIELPWAANRIVVRDRIAYLLPTSTDSRSMLVLDTGESEGLAQETVALDEASLETEIRLDGNRIYLNSDDTNGLWDHRIDTWEILDSLLPLNCGSRIGYLQTDTRIYNIGKAFIGTQDGFYDPVAGWLPVPMFDYYFEVRDVATSDNTAPLGQLYVTPAEIDYANNPEAYSDVVVSMGYAYLIGVGVLTVVDIRDETVPVVVGTYRAFWWNNIRVKAQQNLIFVTGEWGVHIVDISTPTAVTIFTLGGWYTNGAHSDGDLLFVAADDGVHILDISNVTRPVEIDSISRKGVVEDVFVEDGVLYFTENQAGVAVEGDLVIYDAQACEDEL